MPKIKIVDPANAYYPKLNPQRNGWHELYGNSADALNGSISRMFLTGIPQSVPSPALTQDSDYCCGGAACAIALGQNADRPAHNWLQTHGYMSTEWGTEYCGIGAYLATQGYSCEYDGRAYDGVMTGAIYDKMINHLMKGYKVILCMHGTRKGGRTNFYTSNGHFVVATAIEGSTPAPAPTNKIAEDGLWGQDTTRKAQKVFNTYVDGKVSNQNKKMKTYLINCQSASWEFVEPSMLFRGSELVRAIQKKVGASVDGFFGLDTCKALQKFLGVKVDGFFGEKSVKAWQKWLNNH